MTVATTSVRVRIAYFEFFANIYSPCKNKPVGDDVIRSRKKSMHLKTTELTFIRCGIYSYSLFDFYVLVLLLTPI